MFALFALLPGKDWLYLTAIVALLCGFGWYTHKERVYGAAHELAMVQGSAAQLETANASKLSKLAAADAANLATIEASHAQALAASNASTAALAVRLRNAESAVRRGAAVPGNPAAASRPDGAPAVPSGLDEAVAGVVTAAGADAQQVIALQAYIKNVCLK